MVPFHIYTDGSSKQHKGVWIGATAVQVYLDGELIYTHTAVLNPATNNVAELVAVMRGVYYCRKRNPKRPIKVFTDSGYVVTGINKLRRGETHKTNTDVWFAAATILSDSSLMIEQVKGHSGVVGNVAVDKLAYNKLTKYIGSLK